MTDRPALANAIVAVLGAPAIGDRSRIERVLAEHETAQNVHCPNCGCDYQTARDLSEWKDQPELSDRLDAAEARCTQLEQAIQQWASLAKHDQAEHERLRAAVNHICDEAQNDPLILSIAEAALAPSQEAP